MAISTNSMLLGLSPTSGIDVGGALQQAQQLRAQREQMQLQREQFEEQKRRAAEDQRMRQMAEAGEMARARMQGERERAKAAAEAAQKRRDEKIAGYTEFTKLAGSGNAEGARAMVPLMHELGYDVSLEGEVNGLPRFRVVDREAAAAEAANAPPPAPAGDPNESAEVSLSRMQGLGLDTANESGVLNEPAGISEQSEAGEFMHANDEMDTPELDAATAEAVGVDPDLAELGVSSEDLEGGLPARGSPPPRPSDDVFGPSPWGGGPTANAFAQALGASQQARETGQPARAPDEPDYTGAVPRDVIDMGAIQDATLARLDPVMKGLTEAYPEGDIRKSAESTAAGLRMSGLPVAEQVKQFNASQAGPNSIWAAEKAAGIKAGERENLSRVERSTLYGRGFGHGKELSNQYNIGDLIERRKSTAQALEVLTNKDHLDDYMAGATVSRLMGEKGSTTENDINRVLGQAAASFLDRIKNFLYKEAVGGLSLGQRNALIGVLKKSQETDKQRANDFLRGADGILNGTNMDPEEAKGLADYRNALIPEDMRLEYEKANPRKKAAGDAGEPRPIGSNVGGDGSDFDVELEAQAMENDIDPEKLRPIIGGESGGKSSAISTEGASGVMQIMPDNLRAMGIDPEEYRKMSAVEQLPAVMQFLKSQGITADSSFEEYVMAVAASDPKFRNAPDDTVVYKKGSAAWKANAPWRPADGGDITRGSIIDYYRRHAGKKQAAAAPANQNPYDPQAEANALLARVKAKAR